MAADYAIEVVADGMILVRRRDRQGWSGSLWVRVRLRKGTTCVVTRVPLGVGDMAYRPVGNHAYRSERIADSAVPHP